MIASESDVQEICCFSPCCCVNPVHVHLQVTQTTPLSRHVTGSSANSTVFNLNGSFMTASGLVLAESALCIAVQYDGNSPSQPVSLVALVTAGQVICVSICVSTNM